MDPIYLGILVMVGANQKKFKPSVKAIKELYYQKFRGRAASSGSPSHTHGAPVSSVLWLYREILMSYSLFMSNLE